MSSSDLEQLFNKKLVMVTGKGGIGKTFWAAAFAWQAASRYGKKVMLIESAATSQIAPLFGKEPSVHHAVALAPGMTSRNFESERNFEEYIVRYLGQKVLYEKVFSNRLVKSMINMIPGLGELLLLGRLYYYAELSKDERPDIMVLDAYASGHFLSLMSTPDAVLKSSIGGPIQSETQRVKDFLGNQDLVSTIYVAIPEELVISECLDFIPKLSGSLPARISHVVMNRMPSSPDSSQSEKAREFSERHVARARQNLNQLLESQNLPPVTLFPELGFIDEPVNPAVFEEYWQGRKSL